MSEPLWRKKLFSGRWLWAVGSIVMALMFTVTCCAVVWSLRHTIPLEVLILLLGQLLGLIGAVVGFYFMVDRNGHGKGKETP